MDEARQYIENIKRDLEDGAKDASNRAEIVKQQIKELTLSLDGYDTNKNFITQLWSAYDGYSRVASTLSRTCGQLEDYAGRL